MTISSRQPRVAEQGPQLFRERNSTATLHHTTAAIPGGSPEARTSDTRGLYVSVVDLVGEELPAPDIVKYSLERYLDAVHWFMVLFHEPSFRTELQQIISTGCVRKDRSAFLYLAILVVGVGARYAAGSTDAPVSDQSCDFDGLGRRLIQLVEMKLLDVFDESGIEAVQIAVILSSYHLYQGLPKRSFALLGSALKVALSIGLHNESGWGMSDPVVREVWRRLWWALYTAEV